MKLRVYIIMTMVNSLEVIFCVNFVKNRKIHYISGKYHSVLIFMIILNTRHWTKFIK